MISGRVVAAHAVGWCPLDAFEPSDEGSQGGVREGVHPSLGDAYLTTDPEKDKNTQ